MALSNRSCRLALAILLGVLATTLLVVSCRLLTEADLKIAYERQRATVLREATILRVKMEAEVNSTFFLIRGLGSYIESHPDLTQEKFAKIASRMITARPGLRNIAAAPDLVIRYVYPIEGNEAALGLDYRKHPEQRAAAEQVMLSGQPRIAGPMDLVQGGQAIVGRFPVFVPSEEGGDFWGLISTPLEVDHLYEAVGLRDPDLPLVVALRGKDGTGARGEHFFGPRQLFDEEALAMPVQLLSGEWWMAVAPKEGWITRAPNRYYIWGMGVLLTLLLLSLIVLTSAHLDRLERSRDALARANEAQGRFLANMSHEIRTPLNGILGVAELIEDSRLTEEQAEYMRMIKTSGNALLQLLSDILDLSRIDAGKLCLEIGPVALAPFLRDLEGALQIEATNRRVQLSIGPPPEKLAVIYTDATRLRQILWNLLSNAIKFTQDGEVSLTMSSVKAVGGKKRIRFDVTDTGIGIAADRLASIFEEFVQEDSSTTRKYGGTGLGLAIVRRLCRELGGKVEARSRKGEGSCFSVLVPVAYDGAEGAPLLDAKPDRVTVSE